jgi:hypothetical protein
MHLSVWRVYSSQNYSKNYVKLHGHHLSTCLQKCYCFKSVNVEFCTFGRKTSKQFQCLGNNFAHFPIHVFHVPLLYSLQN